MEDFSGEEGASHHSDPEVRVLVIATKDVEDTEDTKEDTDEVLTRQWRTSAEKKARVTTQVIRRTWC